MNFRSYRKKMGWTLDDAAKMLGLADGSTVAKHEIGACFPSIDVLTKYEKLTNGDVMARDFVAARRQFRANPEKARRMVGARTIQRGDREPSETSA